MARVSKGWGVKLAVGAGLFASAAMLPSAVSAFGESFGSRGGFTAFTPASIDPRIAELVAKRSGSVARMMRFTPAGASSWGENRSVTVAVRVDSLAAQAISGRNPADGMREAVADAHGLRLAPTRYNLGLARGYRSFAQAPALSSSLSSAEIPDLSEFTPTPGVREEPSRFAARIELEREQSAAREAEQPTRLGDQMLDVGGSYSLTRNLDVTAGVRYEQDRDLRPLPDLDKQDSQAVYIGTQFRF